MAETASRPAHHAAAAVAPSRASLDEDIEAAELDLKRAEDTVLAAEGFDAEERARDALTRAEIRLQRLLDRREECGSCEGWPRGK